MIQLGEHTLETQYGRGCVAAGVQRFAIRIDRRGPIAALFGVISVHGFDAYVRVRADTNYQIDVTRVASQVVVGIGLNVSTRADELPVETATSLAMVGAPDLDRTALLTAILRRLDARIAQWTDCQGDAAACGLATAYRDACSTIGRPVRVMLTDDRDVRGDAVDVDEGGRLVLRTDAGVERVGAGDVEHLRPA